MKLEPDIATTSIIFRSDENTRKLLQAHDDMVKAIWDACFPIVDAQISVAINPRTKDSDTMVWDMTITSPRGRRSISVTQRKPLGSISFTEA